MRLGAVWVLAVAAVVGLGGAGLVAQSARTPGSPSATERPHVEVASIRQNLRGGPARTIMTRDRITVTNTPVIALIRNAYWTRDDQLTGGPAWIKTDGYDIEATGERLMVPVAKGPPDRRAHLMLQMLLEDRFQLKVHLETRVGPVYELTVAKGGLKMPVQPPESCVDMWKQHADPASVVKPVWCDDWQVAVNGRLNGMPTGRLIGVGITMATEGDPQAGLIAALTNILGRTVIDKTGLTEAYQVHLEWMPDMTGATDEAGHSVPSDDAGPSIFTAVREQLGLELKATKGPVTMLVIDSVQRPSEN